MEPINELAAVIRQEADIAELLETLLKEKQNAFINWKPERNLVVESRPLWLNRSVD